MCHLTSWLIHLSVMQKKPHNFQKSFSCPVQMYRIGVYIVSAVGKTTQFLVLNGCISTIKFKKLVGLKCTSIVQFIANVSHRNAIR